MIVCLSPNGQTHFALDEAPTRLFVGTATGIVHLARDGAGSDWREVGRSLPGKHIGALINAPGGRLFAGCHGGGGVFRSLDEGTSWEAIGQTIKGTDVFSLAVLDTAEGPAILAGTEPVSLFRSDDFGDSWQEYPSIGVVPGAEDWTFPPIPHVPHLKSMTMVPGLPNAFFACVEQGALLRTDDAGRSWHDFTNLWNSADDYYHDAHRLIVAPWNPQLLVFTSGLGLFRSEDAGANWTRIDQIATFTRYPDALVVSAEDRTIYTGGPLDVPVEWFAGSPRGTICRSEDDGRSWTQVDTGLGTGRANIEGLSIVTRPGASTLFAGDTDGRVFMSDNRGDSWSQIAVADAISKGAHHRIAQMSQKLPRWALPGTSRVLDKMFRFTAKRALIKRRAEFARRSVTAGR